MTDVFQAQKRKLNFFEDEEAREKYQGKRGGIFEITRIKLLNAEGMFQTKRMWRYL